MQLASAYWDYIQAILIFTPLSLGLLWIAYTRGFFVLPSSRIPPKGVLSLKSVCIIFAIYLGCTVGVATVFAKVIHALYSFSKTSEPPLLMSWLQLFVFAVTILFFILYCRTLEPTLIKKIWKNQSIPNAKPIAWDMIMGIATWVISFPLVVVIGQIADLLLAIFFNFESYEQVAVRYLKTAMPSTGMFVIALITILVAAPFIEEFLFRGILQTYFKRFVPIKGAIILSALCFALFHYAPSQGIGNLSLFASLFTFALFLGFIYERQGSLFASIGLHMTFNAMSTFRILFMPE
jgi:membrane protease YdiL (CAAX protease family)